MTFLTNRRQKIRPRDERLSKGNVFLDIPLATVTLNLKNKEKSGKGNPRVSNHKEFGLKPVF